MTDVQYQLLMLSSRVNAQFLLYSSVSVLNWYEKLDLLCPRLRDLSFMRETDLFRGLGRRTGSSALRSTRAYDGPRIGEDGT